ncbi:MAG: adenylate/guanylate cyclase domain-containing protein [Caldimonas sp.]
MNAKWQIAAFDADSARMHEAALPGTPSGPRRRRCRQSNPNNPAWTIPNVSDSINPVSTWLAGIGLHRYADAFAEQDISMDVLADLDDADLRELGVATLGDRKRLLKALAAVSAAETPAGSATAASASVPALIPAAFVAGDEPGPAGAAASRPHDAERRQLTVMFCDMVGSTQLSGRLDPEDLQHVIRSFHAAAARAVATYEGHVAQYLGDGVMVYFGFPQAHEDDAERAVRAALALLKALSDLRPRDDIELQTRIGIATGQVVVGEIGTGTSAVETTASGETPNLAARLQGQAGPGEIVMSSETRHLVGASFEVQSLGGLSLKGFAAPVEAWRVVGERTVVSRFEAQHESDLIRLIGRDSEVALLMERWALAREGEGQVVVLVGEAGIGKSRITHTFRERLAGESAATVLLQCSPYFSGSALYPLVRYFERVSGMSPSDTDAERVDKLAHLTGSDLEFPPRSFGYLLRLMGLPDDGRVPPGGDGGTHQDGAPLLQAPIDLLRRLSRHHPVLLLIEDAHWIDPTTAQLGALAIEQLFDARVLILITCRPDFKPTWGNPSNLTRLTLNRLGQKQSMALVAAVTEGKSLPPEVVAEIIRKTDGIPLFVEELTKTVVQSGLLEETPTGYRLKGPLLSLAIPSTLQDSLMARLDRLAPAKEVAQVSALIGREFSRRLLAAVLEMPDAELNEALAELVRAELVVARDPPPDATFSFKHALIRDTASSSLLKSQWVLRHNQIARVLERTEPDTVASQPELLAHHYQTGGEPATAFAYWIKAGELAATRVTYREAAMHYWAALALVPQLEGRLDADAVELELQLKLANLFMQIDGYGAPQTVQAFSRGRELASKLEQVDVYVVACAGLGATMWAAGRYREVIEMMASYPEADLPRLMPMSRVFRALVLGLAEFNMGELGSAASHNQLALDELATVPAAERQFIAGIEPLVMVLSQWMAILVHQGYLDRADAITQEVIERAESLGHPPTRAWALSLARWRAFRRGDMAESIRLSRELLAMADRLGFQARIATGQMMLGRALVANGEVDEGLALLREGYAQWTADGATSTGTEYASHAAEVLLNAGYPADAAEFVGTGERLLAAIDERYFEAELLRQRGRLIEMGIEPDGATDNGMASDSDGAAENPTGGRVDAEHFYRRALDVAEFQGAKLFSLRAATDLARLLGSQGRDAEADAVLRPVYAWFTEGFDYPDLKRARALLA